MRKRKKLLISILSLTLCVLVSFAWIYEELRPAGRLLSLEFEDASVASSNLKVRLYVEDEEVVSPETDINGFLPIAETQADSEEPTEEPTEAELYKTENYAPGTRQKFKVVITNRGDSAVRLRIVLADILCDQALQESIIIGTNGFSGFDINYPAPAVTTEMLSNGMDEGGSFTLVDLVEIPPNKPVAIDFYVMFSASGTADLEDLEFSIGTINFLSL